MIGSEIPLREWSNICYYTAAACDTYDLKWVPAAVILDSYIRHSRKESLLFCECKGSVFQDRKWYKPQKVYLCSKIKIHYHDRQPETIHRNQNPPLFGNLTGQRPDWSSRSRIFHADGRHGHEDWAGHQFHLYVCGATPRLLFRHAQAAPVARIGLPQRQQTVAAIHFCRHRSDVRFYASHQPIDGVEREHETERSASGT